MDKWEFQRRTKALALRIIHLTGRIPQSTAGTVISRQIIRSATSIGANYRAACRAKSTADMINKLKIVEEETDETQYWLELIQESGLVPKEKLKELVKETDEILAMTVSSINTLRKRKS